jgi:hypothetical protein
VGTPWLWTHNAVGQKIEVIVASYRSKSRAPQNRAAVRGCGEQFERVAVVGIALARAAARIAHRFSVTL